MSGPLFYRSDAPNNDALAEAQAKEGDTGESQNVAQLNQRAIAQAGVNTTAQINALREDNARTSAELEVMKNRYTTDMASIRTDLSPIRGSSNRESTPATTEASVERVIKNKFGKN